MARNETVTMVVDTKNGSLTYFNTMFRTPGQYIESLKNQLIVGVTGASWRSIQLLESFVVD